jgi:hypothetical protein
MKKSKAEANYREGTVNLEIVDRRMSAGFNDFGFQGPMPSFQFRNGCMSRDLDCCGK